jgi:uncharacterized protein YecT (DUF1311 family)
MKNLMQVVVIGVIAIMASVVFAAGECDKYKTSYDITYCYCKLFVESDKELNVVYKELKDVLKDDMKKKLTETQREWMKYRNNACEEQPGTINVDCNYQVNKERTEYLRDRSRECKTGNCREDMIVKKSWK